MKILCGDRFVWTGYAGEWRVIAVGQESVRLSKSRTKAALEERTVFFDELEAQWEKK